MRFAWTRAAGRRVAAVIPAAAAVAETASKPCRRFDWSALMKRVFAIAVLVCDACGAAMRILAVLPGATLRAPFSTTSACPPGPPSPRTPDTRSVVRRRPIDPDHSSACRACRNRSLCSLTSMEVRSVTHPRHDRHLRLPRPRSPGPPGPPARSWSSSRNTALCYLCASVWLHHRSPVARCTRRATPRSIPESPCCPTFPGPTGRSRAARSSSRAPATTASSTSGPVAGPEITLGQSAPTIFYQQVGPLRSSRTITTSVRLKVEAIARGRGQLHVHAAATGRSRSCAILSTTTSMVRLGLGGHAAAGDRAPEGGGEGS